MKRLSLRKITLATIFATTSIATTNAFSTSLLEVYQQAMDNDYAYQSAIYAFKEAKLKLPLAYANFLPNIYASYSYTKTDSKTFYPEYPDTYSNSGTSEVVMTQPIFEWSLFANVTYAKAQVAAGYASFLSSKQLLIATVVDDYLAVIRDMKTIEIDEQYLSVLKRFYKIVKNQEEASASTSTSSSTTTSTSSSSTTTSSSTGIDASQIEAAYDQQAVQIINDKNSLETAIEALRSVTHHYYTKLNVPNNLEKVAGLSPSTEDEWVDLAKRGNLTVVSDQANVLAEKASLSTYRGEHLPAIALTPSYAYSSSTFPPSTIKQDAEQKSLTLSISLPLFGNGSTNGAVMMMNTREAEYALEAGQETLDNAVQQADSNTRTYFNNVQTAISSFNAGVTALNSTKSALANSKAGYANKTNTVFDVLSNYASMVNAAKAINSDLMTYFSSIISLKYQAGNLSEGDIVSLNKLFESTVTIPEHLATELSVPSITS